MKIYSVGIFEGDERAEEVGELMVVIVARVGRERKEGV
jgi:hypothetical protein